MTQDSQNQITYTIEHAKPKDAEPILRLKRETWLQTYVNEEEGITRDDIFEKFPDSSIVEAIPHWQAGIASESDDGDRMTFVARQDDQVIGFSVPQIEDGKRKIGSIYVASEFQSKGIGSALLKRALEWLGSEEDIYLDVVAYNHNAINFYKKFGFVVSGESTPLQIDPVLKIKLLPEIEMVLGSKSL